MKIGVIPPVPMEPFLASTNEVTNLWTAYFLGVGREEALETARMAGFPDNFSSWARAIYGLCCSMGIEAVYYPKPGTPKEVKRSLEALSEQNVEAVAFSFPLLRNFESLKKEIDSLCAKLNVEAGILGSVLERYGYVRTALRRFDALQQKEGAFQSRKYVEMLARCMDPQGDLEGLRKRVESDYLKFNELGRERLLRVGLLGLTPARPAFYEVLEANGAIVVFDEWGLENNPMTPTGDLTKLYHECSLPYGLVKRRERLLKEVKNRRIQGFIMGVEYISESIRDEGFFKSALGVPVYSVENAVEGPLSAAEERGIRDFLTRLGRSA